MTAPKRCASRWRRESWRFTLEDKKEELMDRPDLEKIANSEQNWVEFNKATKEHQEQETQSFLDEYFKHREEKEKE